MANKKESSNIEDKARAFLLNAGLTSKHISALEKIGYFTAPASMRHHLNRPGGLIEHSINVTNNTLGLSVFKDRVSAFRFGMLHDLVKCYCYRKSKTGSSYVFAQLHYPGHGVASALIAAELGIQLTDEERTAIVWHMGAFGLNEDQLKEYHAALLRFPRQLILSHAADHLASAFES
jgi:3'-5' exoribonuclease